MAVNLTEEQKRLLEEQRRQQALQQPQLPVNPMTPPDPSSLVGQRAASPGATLGQLPPLVGNNIGQGEFPPQQAASVTQRPADYGMLGNPIYDYVQRALPSQQTLTQQNPNQPVRNFMANALTTGYRLNPMVNFAPQTRDFVAREFPEVSPFVNAVTQPVQGVQSAVARIDQAIPNALTPTTPPAAAPVAPATPQLRSPDNAGNLNYNVVTTPGGVQFENALSSGSVSGLTAEQVARVSAGLRDANINRNVVPSSFFTGGVQASGATSPGGAEAPVQRRLTDEEVSQQYEKSRLEDVLNRPFNASSMSVGELLGAAATRRAAQNRYNDLTRIGAERDAARQQFGFQRVLNADQRTATQEAQAQANDLNFRRELTLERLKQAEPDWSTNTTKVLDANSGAEKIVTTMSDKQGRTYQVPDAEDLAALRALPNDAARIAMLRRTGVPDEHISRYLQGLQ